MLNEMVFCISRIYKFLRFVKGGRMVANGTGLDISMEPRNEYVFYCNQLPGVFITATHIMRF